MELVWFWVSEAVFCFFVWICNKDFPITILFIYVEFLCHTQVNFMCPIIYLFLLDIPVCWHLVIIIPNESLCIWFVICYIFFIFLAYWTNGVSIFGFQKQFSSLNTYFLVSILFSNYFMLLCFSRFLRCINHLLPFWFIHISTNCYDFPS